MHAQGLSHEAVIEIMIALLGLMLTVFGIGIAVIGWFGYTAIRDEAIKQARKQAKKIAEEAAADVFRALADQGFAADYSESQKELPSETPHEGMANVQAATDTPKKRKRAATDSGLKGGKGNDSRSTNKN